MDSGNDARWKDIQRSGAPTTESFQPEVLAEDLRHLDSILGEFFASIAPKGWDARTEKGEEGWTLQQTLAHLCFACDAFHASLSGVLAGHEPQLAGFNRRTDLPEVNEREIGARAQASPAALTESLSGSLLGMAGLVSGLGAKDLGLPVFIPAYNRPLSVAELAGAQLAHPGIVHAAQLANGARTEPLWSRYPPDLMHRMMTRFFHLMSRTYWPERGGDLDVTVNFIARGPGGGMWHVRMSPDGGDVGEGWGGPPVLTVETPTPHDMCQIVTFQVSVIKALLSGKVWAVGSERLGFRLPYLFRPT